jgi:hypothetical protein
MRWRGLLFVLLVVATALKAQAATYDLSPLAIPGVLTTPTGIADNGTVVGTFGIPAQGFVYDGNDVTVVNYPGAGDTYASGISPDGNIVVGYYRDATCISPAVRVHGFTFTLAGSVFTAFDRPGAGVTEGRGVNNTGQVAGLTFGTTAFRRASGGTYTSIAPSGAQSTLAFAINNAGHAVGTYYDSTWVHRAYSWNGSSVTVFSVPGAHSTYPWGINASGVIVGVYIVVGGGASKGFVLESGSYTTLEYPGALYTALDAINASRGHRGLLSQRQRRLWRLSRHTAVTRPPSLRGGGPDRHRFPRREHGSARSGKQDSQTVEAGLLQLGCRRSVWLSQERASDVPIYRMISPPHQLDNPTTRTR